MYEYRFHTMRDILMRAMNGEELDELDRKAIQRKLERDQFHAEQARKWRRERQRKFQEEIVRIMQDAPESGFTATDIQFAMDDFVYRRITNQKVASHLKAMVREPLEGMPQVKRKLVVCSGYGETAMYYIGENLRGGYNLNILGEVNRYDPWDRGNY